MCVCACGGGEAVTGGQGSKGRRSRGRGMARLLSVGRGTEVAMSGNVSFLSLHISEEAKFSQLSLLSHASKLVKN